MKKKKRYEYTITDLFCGAGGTSAGAIEALEILGYAPKLTAINHWPIAIATHRENHPGHDAHCTGVDSVNPRDFHGPGDLRMLLASPECTHHSNARGGRPMHDQSRATAWCVVRWAEACQPDVIIVENVPEFSSWGALGSDGRPLSSKKGKTFQAWMEALRSLGYRVEHRVLCAADYGDPTTRRRLFVQAVRGRRRIVWPEPTHAPIATSDLFGARKAWVPARECVNLEIQGGSIFERKKPLSDKTLRRILEGLRKYGLPGLNLTLDNLKGEPYIVSWDQQSGSGVWSADVPLSSVMTKARHGVAQAYLVALKGSGDSHVESSAKDLELPLGVVCANGLHHGVAQPFLVPNFGERVGQSPRAQALDVPAPAVTGHGAGCLVQPCLINMKGKSNACDMGLPSPSITAHAPHIGVMEPYLVPTCHGGGETRALPLGATMPVVCGNRGDLALIEPSLLPQQSGGALRPITEPCPTISTAGAIGFVDAFLVKYNGTGGAQSLENPCDTISTRERFGLVRPILIIRGEHYELDIRFRMLGYKELALAQGFRRGYKFTGNNTQKVKQIGNAVPRRLARALVLAAVSQDSDISRHIPINDF